MLKNADAIATIAVKDLAAAKKFYGETLGLVIAKSDEDVLNLESGNSKLIIYRSQFAGTNKATVCNWAVEDVEAEAKALAAKGVKFERYEMPGVEHRGDVHVFGEFKTAWFKDPDGNILSLVPR